MNAPPLPLYTNEFSPEFRWLRFFLLSIEGAETNE